ncbi:MAG TPA: hypothetical protein VFV94_11060 [Polyangiaceae bacterium]|nr:hypothetical protein [Polyangiaceae bacterium]
MRRFRCESSRVAWFSAALLLAACSLGYDPDELTSGPPPNTPQAGASGAAGGGRAGAAGSSASGAAGGGRGGASAAGKAGEGGEAGEGTSAGKGGTSGAGKGGSAGSAGNGGTSGASGATAGTAGSGQSAGTGGTSAGPTELYWLEEGSDTVNRANADGSSPELLVSITSLDSYLRSIAIDTVHGKLYFSDDQRGRVEWSDLDGDNVTTCVGSLDHPVGIDLDLTNGKLYIVDRGTVPAVYRANLDGSGLEPLITDGLDHPYGIALDVPGNRMFLVDNDLNQVLRADLDGGNLVDLGVPDVGTPIQIALDPDGGKLYWSELGPPARIRRANVDGSSPEDLVVEPDVDTPLGVKVDVVGRKLYFADGAGTISRSDLDGSNRVPLLTDLDGPVGLVLRY